MAITTNLANAAQGILGNPMSDPYMNTEYTISQQMRSMQDMKIAESRAMNTSLGTFEVSKVENGFVLSMHDYTTSKAPRRWIAVSTEDLATLFITALVEQKLEA